MIRKVVRGIGWAALSLLVILLLAILLIRLPYVQNKITQKVISFVEQKIGTEVSLKRIYLEFPKSIVIEELYLADQSKDTLLFVGNLSVNTDLWALMQRRITLKSVDLSDSKISVKRTKTDSAFNFSYIIRAFASTPGTPDSTVAPWEFSLNKLSLSHLVVAFHDQHDGNIVDVNLGELALHVDELDLSKSLYKVSTLELSNTQASIKMLNGESGNKPPSDNSGEMPDLDLGDTHLKNVRITYENSNARQHLNLLLGELTVESNGLDLRQQKIDLEKIELLNSFISYHQAASDDSINERVKADTVRQLPDFTTPWDIRLNRLLLSKNGLQYDDSNFNPNEKSFDPNHFWIFGLEAEAKDLVFEKGRGHADVQNLAFQEKKGMTLRSLSFQTTLTETEFQLDDLKLKTGHSNLWLSATTSFSSLAEAIRSYEEMEFQLRVKESILSLSDVQFFVPQADSLPLNWPPNGKLVIATQMRGTLGDLEVKNLAIQILDSTRLKLAGTVSGLPNRERLALQIQVNELHTTQSNLSQLLPDSLAPMWKQLPAWMTLTGSFNGTMQRADGAFALETSSGKLNVKGKYEDVSTPHYDAEIRTTQLDLGKLLNQEDLGAITMRATIDGNGSTLEQLDVKIDAIVDELEFNNYVYKDFKINGAVADSRFSGTASLADENLDFTIKGDIDYSNADPFYKLGIDLKNANFQKLNLSERPLKARGQLDAGIGISDSNSINGAVTIRKVGIYNGEALYLVDSLLFASIDQEGESSISVRSDIVSGDFKGTFNLLNLPQVLKQHFNQYFSMQDTAVTNFSNPQNFEFDLTITNTDLLTEIIFPDLEPFVPGKIHGAFDSELNTLELDIEIAKIRYASIGMDSMSLRVNSDKRALWYGLRLKNVTMDSLRIDALQLSGELANDSLQTALFILDSLGEKKYALGGVVNSRDHIFQFSLNKNEVMLNYEPWSVPQDNYLQFGTHSIKAHHFSLAKEQEKMSILSNESDSSFVFQFDQFQISNFTKMASGVVPASGLLNGELKFTTARGGEFTSDLDINKLSVLEMEWGDASINLTHANDAYNADLKIKGENLNLHGIAYYNPTPTNSDFKIDLTFSPLNMAVVEPLSFGQLKNVKGTLEGTIKLAGSMRKPLIRGDITFKDVGFLSTYLNNSFTLQNEHISFQESGIVLNDFKVKDANNNEATLRGEIQTTDYKKFGLNLRMNARNFQVLNTKQEDNSLYYGLVKINMDARISGSSQSPKVDMSMKLSKDTELTYVIPASEKTAMEAEGIVQFVDRDAIKDPFLADLPDKDSVGGYMFMGVALTADVDIADDATLHIVIDPVTGDKLSVNGNAKLVLDMSPSGDMNLSGRYEITKGTYNFSFHNIVKREFNIEKGSAIVWSGDPLNASMDIRAIYRVETSPIDLVYNQINTTNQSEINSYSARLPFLVYLLIKGKLLAPDIGFKIDMPEADRNAMGGSIYAKLQDINTRESDLNKQVFALLILKRFISDSPLESQARSGLSNTARMSVSRVLSDQLNRLSQNIKGVKLSVDVKSYQNYSGTEAQGETKVQLGVSKSLFDDRLVVKVSGNVDVEGKQTNNATDYIGDIALEYKLTSDGRFRITGFRNSNFDMIDGELTETGAGLIFIKDYNTLRELFKSNVKEE